MLDKLRFYVHFILKFGERKRFKKETPDVKIPPDYLIYESFNLNYNSYYHGGRKSAEWLLHCLEKHVSLTHMVLLDWGCGPARIVRHMPDLLDKSCKIYATDYNARTIAWNKKNIKDVIFSENKTNPPLSYDESFFHIVYGISIFTHLPEELHYSWFNELVRVTKNGGIVFLTLQGDAFRMKLTDDEQKAYEKGYLVIRGKTKIGHRTYSAFHPKDFVHKLMDGHQILEHIPGEIIHNKPSQDVWIVKIIKE